MPWLRRRRHAPPAKTEAHDERGARRSPGVAALLAETSEDGSHSILDLGQATDSSLRVYSRFAHRVRFADFLAALSRGSAAALEMVPLQPEHPYDLVFVWDVLDRLAEEARPHLVERLAEVTAPNARLHALVDSSDRESRRPFHFHLLDVDRVQYEPAGRIRPRPPGDRLLPAQVERLIEPFQVVRGFTLKDGLREYVAVRP